MLLDGINHIAWMTKDVGRLGRFYAEVFDAGSVILQYQPIPG